MDGAPQPLPDLLQRRGDLDRRETFILLENRLNLFLSRPIAPILVRRPIDVPYVLDARLILLRELALEEPNEVLNRNLKILEKSDPKSPLLNLPPREEVETESFLLKPSSSG